MRSSPYLEALRWTRAYRKVVVTGSQRSGTTVCARMLAADRGWDFIDETRIGTDGTDDTTMTRLRALLDGRDGFVLQMPNLLMRTGEVADLAGTGRTGILVMRRPFREVEASRQRIGLLPRLPLMEYRQLYIEHCLQGRPHMRVLDYADLEGHPMHVPKDQRRNFKPKQTTLE